MSGYIDTQGQTSEPDANHFLAAAEFVLMLRQKGVRDTAVLRAMEQVARIPFIREDYHSLADDDLILPMDAGQMMLAPSMVAKMLEALDIQKEHRVLLLGTGTGYMAALLTRLAAEIITIERIKSLADDAHDRLRKLGYARIDVIYADGQEGHISRAPYDRIISTFQFTEIPDTLIAQLKDGGIIVSAFKDKGLYVGQLINDTIDFTPLRLDNLTTEVRDGVLAHV